MDPMGYNVYFHIGILVDMSTQRLEDEGEDKRITAAVYVALKLTQFENHLGPSVLSAIKR